MSKEGKKKSIRPVKLMATIITCGSFLTTATTCFKEAGQDLSAFVAKFLGSNGGDDASSSTLLAIIPCLCTDEAKQEYTFLTVQRYMDNFPFKVFLFQACAHNNYVFQISNSSPNIL
jgi:hypothetical protein